MYRPTDPRGITAAEPQIRRLLFVCFVLKYNLGVIHDARVWMIFNQFVLQIQEMKFNYIRQECVHLL